MYLIDRSKKRQKGFHQLIALGFSLMLLILGTSQVAKMALEGKQRRDEDRLVSQVQMVINAAKAYGVAQGSYQGITPRLLRDNNLVSSEIFNPNNALRLQHAFKSRLHVRSENIGAPCGGANCANAFSVGAWDVTDDVCAAVVLERFGSSHIWTEVYDVGTGGTQRRQVQDSRLIRDCIRTSNNKRVIFYLH